MLFHSLQFLVLFLPAALLLFYGVARIGGARGRPTLRWLLIGVSLVFYGAWDVRFVPLLVLSVSGNWLLSRLYARHPFGAIVGAGVVLNLTLLGIFKYADFFASDVAGLFGAGATSRLDLALPLGISFFTFQQISYLVDLRRGRTRPYAFSEYAAYVMFFPHLIAGPIVRHSELIAQFHLDPWRTDVAERFGRGLVLLVIGLVKKVYIADPLAAIADPVFAPGVDVTFVSAWVGTLAFTFQIYFDFSGYSDMAIGLAKMFGYDFPINFDAPYRAASIREFWRRWHMTLSRFLRDYLYIPLGGNRAGPARQLVAVIVTMALGGLWHGAGWTFVVWGLLHGAALAVNQAWARLARPLPAGVAWTLTMAVVIVGWVLFRAPDLPAAATLLQTMVAAHGVDLALPGLHDAKLWIIAVAAAVALVGPTSQQVAFARLQPGRIAAATTAVALVLVILKVGGGDNAEFIYFQF